MTVLGFFVVDANMFIVSLSAAMVRAVQAHPNGRLATHIASGFLAFYLFVLQLFVVAEVQIGQLLLGKRLGVKNMRAVDKRLILRHYWVW